MPVKRRRLLVVIAVVVAVVSAIVLLALVPVPQHFALRNAAIYDGDPSGSACPGIDTTQGTVVSFHWNSGAFTYFFVVGCGGQPNPYDANGTSGSGSFVSAGGMYEFGGSCPSSRFCVPANVSGSYTGPLLAL